jgi:hypothetical protein
MPLASVKLAWHELQALLEAAQRAQPATSQAFFLCAALGRAP